MRPVPALTAPGKGLATTLPSAVAGLGGSTAQQLSSTAPPVTATTDGDTNGHVDKLETYADVFNGVRQDSGDPLEFVKVMRDFYAEYPTKGKKTIVFSDSLNIDRCIQYKTAAEEAGFLPSFGIGTFFTSKVACSAFEVHRR